MPDFVSIIVHINTTPELFIDKLLELDRVVESFHTIELQGHLYEYRMSFEHIEPKRWTGIIDLLVFEIPAKTQGWLRKLKFILTTDAPLSCIASMEISETTPSHICVDLFSNHLDEPAVYEVVVGLLLDMTAYWPEINEQLEGIKEKLQAQGLDTRLFSRPRGIGKWLTEQELQIVGKMEASAESQPGKKQEARIVNVVEVSTDSQSREKLSIKEQIAAAIEDFVQQVPEHGYDRVLVRRWLEDNTAETIGKEIGMGKQSVFNLKTELIKKHPNIPLTDERRKRWRSSFYE